MKKRAQSPDVLVVGGGIMGTSAALELARQGAQVEVLEKAVPGAEASSAAAGILGAEVEAGAPGPMLELARKSRELYPKWVARLEAETQLSVGYLEGGSLQLALDPEEGKVFTRERRFQLKEGTARRLTHGQARKLEPALGASIHSALYYPNDARLTPADLFKATQVAARRAGVGFRSGATVRRVVTAQGGTRIEGVEIEGGELLRASVVVVAAGSWTPLVAGLPLRRGDVIPARGQLVELALPAPPLERLVFGQGCYLIPRADGRVVVGSTLEFVGFRRGVTASAVHGLLETAIRLVPELSEAEVLRSWSNFRPYTPDHLPLLGTAGVDGLIIASGHYRTGILLTPITAQIVARLAAGRNPPLSLAPFDPLRCPQALPTDHQPSSQPR